METPIVAAVNNPGHHPCNLLLNTSKHKGRLRRDRRNVWEPLPCAAVEWRLSYGGKEKEGRKIKQAQEIKGLDTTRDLLERVACAWRNDKWDKEVIIVTWSVHDSK